MSCTDTEINGKADFAVYSTTICLAADVIGYTDVRVFNSSSKFMKTLFVWIKNCLDEK